MLHQLNFHVQALYYERCDAAEQASRAEEQRQAVAAFFRAQRPDVYANWRQKILFLCLRQGMTFAQFQQAASGLSLTRNLREQWKTELPLHCLTTACEAFWAGRT